MAVRIPTNEVIPMAIMLNEQMENNVRTGLMSASSQLKSDLAAYEQHNIRNQLLKMGAGEGRTMMTGKNPSQPTIAKKQWDVFTGQAKKQPRKVWDIFKRNG